ncbi:MAG: hypothetical protein GY950_23645 [bacterium]|nr:hypothetical protein [bacterium]
MSQTLPGYMIPLHFVQMEALPLTPGGKIDRKALPEPEILSTRQYVAPTNEKEERLAEIWSEILGVEKNRIGIHDDFFELGGHSLKMLNLLTRVYKEFKVQLKLTDIFRDSTIAASAGLISRLKQGTYLDIRPVEKREYYDPPFQDIGMWLRCRFQVKDRKPFNMSGIYDLVGVSRVLVETVCRDLVRHHETLRTTFLTVDGEAKIKIHPVESVDVNPDYIDLRKKRMSAKKLRKFLFKLQQSDFDLEKGPVFKITLVQLSDREFKLVFVVPHIISDLWSKVSLEQDFRTLLEAYSNGRKNSLAPLTVQYKDYAAWQHRLFTGERGKRLRAFWLDMLGGELPPPNPLMDFPHNRRTGTYRQLLAEDIRGSFRPLTPEESNSLTGVLASARSVKGTSYRFFIPRDTTDKLNLLAGEARCSFFSVISAAFNILHYLMTGQRDCITGTVVAIRDHEDLKKIQGYFMNTVLFRNQVDEVLTVKEYVVRAAGNISEALDHREYPFEKILAELDVALDTVGSVFLNYSKADGDQEVAVEKLKSGHTPVEHVYFDMDYSIVEFKNGIVVHCNYNNELFKPGTIELISLKFTALTAEMAGAYHRVIKELDID